MLYSHATEQASQTDNESDEMELTCLIDLAPFRKAAENWFADVQYYAPRSDDEFLAFRLGDLERYGPTTVATVTTTTTTTIEQNGLKRTTSTTSTAVHPALEQARKRAG